MQRHAIAIVDGEMAAKIDVGDDLDLIGCVTLHHGQHDDALHLVMSHFDPHGEAFGVAPIGIGRGEGPAVGRQFMPRRQRRLADTQVECAGIGVDAVLFFEDTERPVGSGE